jgi:hexosaminidase
MKTIKSVLIVLFAVAMDSMAVSSEVLPIIPMPAQLERQDGVFTLTPAARIVADDSAKDIADQLKQTLADSGVDLKVEPISENVSNAIRFKLNAGLSKDLGPEGYRLSVTPDGIDIQAPKPAGLFYGMQTLLQLLPEDVYGQIPSTQTQWTVPCVRIQDVPRFAWRGMHLDVCRHFMPKEFVKKYIDLLALHKMNRFHWHLTDDQGWRIEIKQYPKLTEVGAWRAESIVGLNHKPPRTFDGKPHGGFYTQEDIRDIVEYARKRFITVIPEIEMPGHVQAAIAAYPELGTTGKSVPVLTWWGGCEEILNVEESTVLFMQNVLTEVLALFDSEFIHIGGDEVNKQPWKDSPRVQARMKELNIAAEEELQSWFIHRMDQFLTEHGRRLVGWDEILEGGLAPGATVMSWRGEEGGIKAAEAGHDVIMAPSKFTYFDFCQGDPATEPLAYPKQLTLETVYSYDPMPAVLEAENRKHILGVQAQIWTEYIPDWRQAEYQAYPRGCALAEVAWSPVESKDYEAFLTRLQTHLKRLSLLDVNYRPLKPEEGKQSPASN